MYCDQEYRMSAGCLQGLCHRPRTSEQITAASLMNLCEYPVLQAGHKRGRTVAHSWGLDSCWATRILLIGLSCGQANRQRMHIGCQWAAWLWADLKMMSSQRATCKPGRYCAM